MNGYVLGVMGTVLISAILTAILPEGKTAETIRNITRITCLLIIVAPIPQLFHSDFWATKNTENFFSENVIQTDETFIKYYSELRIEQTENALEQELYEKFSVVVAVELICSQAVEDSGEIPIEKICVKLETTINEEEEKGMWEYLKKNYCSEVLIE